MNSQKVITDNFQYVSLLFPRCLLVVLHRYQARTHISDVPIHFLFSLRLSCVEFLRHAAKPDIEDGVLWSSRSPRTSTSLLARGVRPRRQRS
jgi:hypothetical protein